MTRERSNPDSDDRGAMTTRGERAVPTNYFSETRSRLGLHLLVDAVPRSGRDEAS